MAGIDSSTKLITHFNNDFIDIKGHLLSPVGSPFIGSSKFGGGAIKFNGTNQSISIPDSPDWDLFGSNVGDYTIDCWVKLQIPPIQTTFVSQHQPTGVNYWHFGTVSAANGALRLNVGINGVFNNLIDGTINLHDDTWHHIALIKVGTEFALYVDGVQDAYRNITDTVTFAGPLYVGVLGTIGSFLKGQMDELRIQKSNAFSAAPNVGKTDTITVPTSSYIFDADTKLLLHFDGDLTDSGNNGHIATLIGDAFISEPKFGSGNLILDGTNDYLTVGDTSTFKFLHGALDVNNFKFTIDCWLKLPNTGVMKALMTTMGGASDQVGLQLVIQPNGQVGFTIRYGVGGQAIVSGGMDLFSLDEQWHHFALTYDHSLISSNLKLFLDGILQPITLNKTGNIPSTANSQGSLTIGTWAVLPVDFLKGQVDEIRISDIVRWDTNFTPALSQYTSDANTKLLMHFNDNYKDDSGLDHVVSAIGSPTFSDAKIGTGSSSFNGTSQYLTVGDPTSFKFLHGALDPNNFKFTIDCWLKATNTGIAQYIANTKDTASNHVGIEFTIQPSGALTFAMRHGVGGQWVVIGFLNFIAFDSTWQHIALTHDQSLVTENTKLFIDGILQPIKLNKTANIPSTSNSQGPLTIGAVAVTPSNYLKGNIDELRISDNIRWVVDFIPQTTQYITDANTKLLMHFDGNALDNSASAHIVTNNGATFPNAKFGTDAVIFNGTSQYLEIPDHPVFSPGTGDFTFDFWIKLDAVNPPLRRQVFGGALTPSSDSTIFTFFSSSTAGSHGWEVTKNTVTTIVPDPLVLPNVWYHIAVVRTSGVVKIFRDGVQKGSDWPYTENLNFNNPFRIGAGHTITSPDVLNGKLDEFRFSNVARWTSNFTPETTAYVSDVNTNLLLHFNGDLLDSSNIGQAVTNVDSSLMLSPKFGSGSLTLNGIDQYLTIPDAPDWDILANATEDWTIDLWVKLTVPASQHIFINHLQNSASDYWWLGSTSSGALRFAAQIAGPLTHLIDGTINIQDGNWHHIVFSKVGTIFGGYVDGVQDSYASNTNLGNFAGNLFIGTFNAGGPFAKGQMDELRIQKSNAFGTIPNVGKTDTIIVPTSAHVEDANTKLLLHFDGNTNDSSGSLPGHVVSQINNPLLVSNKFGQGALHLNGSTDYLEVQDSPIFAPGTGDFTIDTWVKLAAINPSPRRSIFGGHGVPANDNTIFSFFSSSTAGAHGWQVTKQTLNFIVPDPSVVINTWYHLAVVRVSGVIKIFRDGIQKGADWPYTENLDWNTPFRIGASHEILANAVHCGDIDEFRFSDVARWATNFTPPSAEYFAELNKKYRIINT